MRRSVLVGFMSSETLATCSFWGAKILKLFQRDNDFENGGAVEGPAHHRFANSRVIRQGIRLSKPGVHIGGVGGLRARAVPRVGVGFGFRLRMGSDAFGENGNGSLSRPPPIQAGAGNPPEGAKKMGPSEGISQNIPALRAETHTVPLVQIPPPPGKYQ